MITPTMTVADVLAQHPQTLAVFVQQHSAFKRLESPLMRKTFARLVTVEQAAGIARIDVGTLVAALNASCTGSFVVPIESHVENTVDPAPVWYNPHNIALTVDVRHKESHESPLALIMQAAKGLKKGEILHVRNSFEPLPLYEVLGRWGLQHWAYQDADDDWHVFFYGQPDKPQNHASTAQSPSNHNPLPTPASTPTPTASTVILDHRGLPPPEPMRRTLAALQTLPHGQSLVLLTDRHPVFLYEALDDQGYTYQTLPNNEAYVRTLITKA